LQLGYDGRASATADDRWRDSTTEPASLFLAHHRNQRRVESICALIEFGYFGLARKGMGDVSDLSPCTRHKRNQPVLQGRPSFAAGLTRTRHFEVRLAHQFTRITRRLLQVAQSTVTLRLKQRPLNRTEIRELSPADRSSLASFWHASSTANVIAISLFRSMRNRAQNDRNAFQERSFRFALLCTRNNLDFGQKQSFQDVGFLIEVGLQQTP